MLGDKVGEERGRVTGRRVLPGDDPRYVKMEISFETEPGILGIKGTNIGTFVAYERIPGQMYGEGRGILMMSEGASAIWNGGGVGAPTGEGMGVRFAAAVTLQAAPGSSLARLNGVVLMVEDTEAGDGTVHTTLTEWK